jgi:hypothetical protein
MALRIGAHFQQGGFPHLPWPRDQHDREAPVDLPNRFGKRAVQHDGISCKKSFDWELTTNINDILLLGNLDPFHSA